MSLTHSRHSFYSVILTRFVWLEGGAQVIEASESYYGNVVCQN